MNDAFALQLTAQTKTHIEWLSVMRFGMATLMQDQQTLMQCVFVEAKRESERGEGLRKSQTVANIAAEIFDELRLKVGASAGSLERMVRPRTITKDFEADYMVFPDYHEAQTYAMEQEEKAAAPDDSWKIYALWASDLPNAPDQRPGATKL